MTGGPSPTPVSTLEVVNELIESLRKPASFWRIFKSVKFDSDDSGDIGGDRVIVIVAKGEAADLLSDAYDVAVADLPEGDRGAIS